MEFLKSIPELIRLPTQILVAVAFSSGLILFLPDNYVTHLGVDQFVKAYHLYIGPAFIISSAWLVARLVSLAIEPLQEKRNLARLRESIKSLTPDEKKYLSAFIFGRETTIYVPVDDGIIGSLKARKVVYRSSNVFNVLKGVPYNLQPWAREWLEKNPQLLSSTHKFDS